MVRYSGEREDRERERERKLPYSIIEEEIQVLEKEKRSRLHKFAEIS